MRAFDKMFRIYGNGSNGHQEQPVYCKSNQKQQLNVDGF